MPVTFDPCGITPGAGRVEVRLVAGQSAIVSMQCRSPMKILAPRSRGTSVWAFTSSFGGGLVAGDQTSLDLQIEAGARCFLGTQASTKIYRNPAGRPCSHSTFAGIESEALLVFAPDPVQSFAGSSYLQRQEFRMSADSGLVLVDWFTAGRAACGERWAFNRFHSRSDVFVDDRRIFLDSIALEPARSAWSREHSVGRHHCFATLVLMGALVRERAANLLRNVAARPIERNGSLVVSASALPHGAVLRVAAGNVETVARELHAHLKPLDDLLGDDPWDRKW